MAMLSNKLQYLARKNKKFLSRSSGNKGSRKEDQKGCFNCKKSGHFIFYCPDLQEEKSMEKSKKPTFKSNKFRRQIKQSLMVTREDLDSESRADKDCHTPFFDQLLFFLLVFWTHFTQLFSQHLQFISQYFTVYFPTYYLFISQHLSVHFANIFISIFYQHFICLCFNLSLLFPRFTHLLNLRSFVVSDEISAERYFKIPHFCSEGTYLNFIIFYLYYFVFLSFYYFYLLIFFKQFLFFISCF